MSTSYGKKQKIKRERGREIGFSQQIAKMQQHTITQRKRTDQEPMTEGKTYAHYIKKGCHDKQMTTGLKS